MSQLQYWVWLSMRFGVRPKMKLALVEHFGTPRDVYFATEADYRVRVPLRPEELRLLLDKDLKDANRALAICDREHIRVLTIQDAAYPQRLLQIVAAIDAPGTQVDLIIEKTQLPASKVLAELTVLQIRGVVRQEPGKRFSLNVRAGTAQES